MGGRLKLCNMYAKTLSRYKSGAISEARQLLPKKTFPDFVSDLVEKIVFVHLKSPKNEVAGMQSFARSLVGFLSEYVAALADPELAPASIFSDMLKERSKALLNIVRVAAAQDGGDPVRSHS